MQVAILSDIHGNLEALTSVINDLEERSPDKVICLGDMIGYGPDPNEVINLIRKKGYIAIQGNHEAALADRKMRNLLNFQAKENSTASEKLISPDNLAFCSYLPRNYCIENAQFVHGFPPESVLGYVTMIPDEKILSFFKNSTRRLFFVGHTHDLLVVSWDGKALRRERFCQRKYLMENDNHYIINVGSVGQPRDGNNHAKYILWETASGQLEVIYIPYDYETTAQKINERGFPAAYGRRLR